ncbi:hypothetical protein MYX77_07680 [Acidobacteriia bacterium AH_259_A11_L15]|nr:hypothetical protein [Acidobacteriia bacterium AH_259_A11_L15]
MSGKAADFESEALPAPIVALLQNQRPWWQTVSPAETFVIRLGIIVLRLLATWLQLRLGVWRRKSSMVPSRSFVDSTYTRIARRYAYAHALTTNGRDAWWRREVAWEVAPFLKRRLRERPTSPPVLLDLCTGTGLSLVEVLRILALENVSVKAIGIDINEAMLGETKNTVAAYGRDWLSDYSGTLEFARADASDLLGRRTRRADLQYFEPCSVACITSICGTGGLTEPIESFRQHLEVLDDEGMIVVLDMHCPIPDLASTWPPFHRQTWPAFEQAAWEEVTVPDVLQKLWAWCDPTLFLHAIPFVTIFVDSSGHHYGFRLLSRQIRTEPWWFGLPVMSMARIVAQKTRITPDEARLKKETLRRIQGALREGG